MGRSKIFVATATRGVEEVLAAELRDLGIQRLRVHRGAVEFHGKLEDGYRAILWSRVASRILLRIGRCEVRNAGELYDGARDIRWEDHVAPGRTIAVDFVGRSEEIRDSRFGAMKTKDAMVDRLRDLRGFRPDVDPKAPDVRAHVHLDHAVATFSLDLCGEALHLRSGEGRLSGTAPLRETLAAALLRLCEWPKRAREEQSFFDPFCGRGTFLLEAISMARQLAPALRRRRFGFLGWDGHEARTWAALVEEANEKVRPADDLGIVFSGSDGDRQSVRTTRQNLARSGLGDLVRIEMADVAKIRPGRDVGPGLVVANPPYGRRLGDADDLAGLYQVFGDRLRHEFLGWHAGVLVAYKTHAAALGLKPQARHAFFNGPIECRLLEIPISSTPPKRASPGWRR